MTDWTIILRSLQARKFSTLTTIVTVAVAVAMMLVLVTMREAGKKAFERGCGDMHLLVSADASPLSSVLNGVFYANPPRRPLPWARFEALKTSAPWAYAVPIQQGDSFKGQPVLATNADFFLKFKPNPNEPWQLADGRFFNTDFEVVVGADAARTTGLRVGSKVYLTHGTGMSREGIPADPEPEGHDDHADHADHDHDHDAKHVEGDHSGHVHRDFVYTVVGVLKPTGGSHDRALITNLESTWIIHAKERLEKAGRHEKPTPADLTDEDRKITGVYLRLITREGSDTPANLPAVFDSLRRDTSVTVAAPFDEIRTLDVIVGNVNRVFIAVAGAVMLSSGIAIMLALYNSMEQRRRQIAVLRVLGASKPRIFGLVVTESAIIGLLGAAAGIALGFAGAIVAAAVMKDKLQLLLDPSIPPRALVAVALATVLLAAAAGVVPAFAAYRTSVARNLRPIG
ncbi:MAG: ABC transporter permease [Planctomycetes bacterium]|nr:ABC transporter permease [Planctomycetota bacterium]